MKLRSIGIAAALTVGVAVAIPATPANAADFCAGKIGASSYYQRNFSSGGAVVATLCAPAYNAAGNAYLYARGRYASVSKYMKLSVSTNRSAPAVVDGNYYEYVYVARPAGLHDYYAVMFDGNGNRIVNSPAIDYE